MHDVNVTLGTQAGLYMELTVCNSGLKVITKEQGLTEYRAHRITYNICPEQYPKLFVWVYKHEGKKLKVGSHSRLFICCPCSQCRHVVLTSRRGKWTKAADS